jgi:hypothetical protein
MAIKEADLTRREKNLQKKLLDASKELEQVYSKKMNDAQSKFNKECNILQKKINSLERNMMNKIKLAQS